MKLTRRDFVHAGCTVAAASLVPSEVDAFTHGVAISGVGGSQSRVNINVPSSGQVYLNLAKGLAISLPPGSANQTNDGYPVNGILASATTANMGFPSGYFGKFAWQWTGTGSMESNGPPWIVYSGGLSVYPNAGAAQDGNGGMIIAPNSGTAGITNPLVIFNFGWNIQSISNDGTGKILVTVKTGFYSNFWQSINQQILISGTGTSADSATPWQMTYVNNNSFTLNGSTFVSGNASPAGTAIMDNINSTISLFAGQTFTNMTNLIICKYTNGTTDDYHDITVNGYITDTALVNQLIYLNNAGSRGTPAWLRFMDLLNGGRGFNGDFANRTPVTALTYNHTLARWINNYWVTSITNTSDALACLDPTTSVWGGSAYNDGAVVQGPVASTNTTGYPTLAVGGHPAAPIYWNDHGNQHNIINIPSGAASAGQIMQLTFNVGGASYLNGGSNYTFSYTTVAGDVGSAVTLLINLGNALNANTTLTNAKMQFNVTTSSLEIYVFCPTPHANGTTGAASNAMVITYSGAPTCNLYRLPASTLVTTGCTFIFNALLNGWMYIPGGKGQNVVLELLIDCCNRVGAHCYFNWDFTTSSYVTSTTNFFATNLTSGLKFGTEVLNEVWNPGAEPHFASSSFGSCLGWAYNAGQASLGILGLRTVQYAALSRAAWAAAGKPASNHVVCSQLAIFGTGVGSDFYNYQLTGTIMNGTSFPFYASYGGLGATSTANHDTQGTRPIDASDYIGCAPYWGSPWFGGVAYNAGTFGGLVGTVAQNSPMLQASFDYANGSPATAFASLVNQFNGTTLRSDFDTGNVLGPIHAGVQGTSYDDVFAGMEATAAAFDTYRTTGGGSPLAAGANKLGILCYEGGPNWAMGADPNSGVNSPVGSPSSADITALTNAFTSLGWTTTQLIPYTVSGTGAFTEVATNILNATQAWKFDASYKNFIKTSYYQKLYNVSGANREVHPAQYGYNASQWGLFPGLYSAGNQYTNYDAIHEWSA